MILYFGMTVCALPTMSVDCGVQLVPDLRRQPAGRGCSVETDQFASRDIRYPPGAVSFQRLLVFMVVFYLCIYC